MSGITAARTLTSTRVEINVLYQPNILAVFAQTRRRLNNILSCRVPQVALNVLCCMCSVSPVLCSRDLLLSPEAPCDHVSALVSSRIQHSSLELDFVSSILLKTARCTVVKKKKKVQPRASAVDVPTASQFSGKPLKGDDRKTWVAAQVSREQLEAAGRSALLCCFLISACTLALLTLSDLTPIYPFLARLCVSLTVFRFR